MSRLVPQGFKVFQSLLCVSTNIEVRVSQKHAQQIGEHEKVAVSIFNLIFSLRCLVCFDDKGFKKPAAHDGTTIIQPRVVTRIYLIDDLFKVPTCVMKQV